MTDTPIPDAEVLGYVNRVREAWGWRKLAQLPKGVPMMPCMCVLGRSWEATVLYDNVSGGWRESDTVTMRFQTESQSRLVAEAFGLPYDYAADRVSFPADHPLIRWMIEFDSCHLPHLIAADAEGTIAEKLGKNDEYPIDVQPDELPDLILA